MTGPQFTVRRVRACRWPKACGLCGAHILTGSREALIEPPDGSGPCRWCHLDCVLAIKTSARPAS